MNPAILDSKVQDYINRHFKSDPAALILKGVPFNNITPAEVVEQIEAKQRCEKKLPTWFQQPLIYYPNKLHIEQTSSEITAAYKSQYVKGQTLIDLTGGFGVDSFYFSKIVHQVEHCELNPKLSRIAGYNFGLLGDDRLKTHSQDGLTYLEGTSKTYDWLYIDPSRRHESKGKVFLLKDCLPNIPQHLDRMWRKSKNIMIKTSPLLDLTIGTNELAFVKEIHVIAVNNDVKELLWLLEHRFSGPITIKTANLKKMASDYFDFIMHREPQTAPHYSTPLAYLYEPNSAILKSGGFNSLATAFNIAKLHKHSHLYTSATLLKAFPGRAFKILKTIPYNKRQIRQLGIDKANIAIRNFPESVQNIRKLFKIKDGGMYYLFFTTNVKNEKIVVVGTKPTQIV